MEEATATETEVSQVQIDEMDRTVTLVGDLAVAALLRGKDTWQVIADAGMRLNNIMDALVESGLAPEPTPREE